MEQKKTFVSPLCCGLRARVHPQEQMWMNTKLRAATRHELCCDRALFADTVNNPTRAHAADTPGTGGVSARSTAYWTCHKCNNPQVLMRSASGDPVALSARSKSPADK
jgi:hypothetical protein